MLSDRIGRNRGNWDVRTLRVDTIEHTDSSPSTDGARAARGAVSLARRSCSTFRAMIMMRRRQ
jgi:hypothetical protein